MEHSKTLLFVVDFGKHWMGGVYYVRNLMTTILSNREISNSSIYLLCPREHRLIFENLSANHNVKIIDRNPIFQKINAAIRKLLTPVKRDFPVDVVWYAQKLNATSVFPVTTFPFIGGSSRCIFWIPDFQHFKLSHIFSAKEYRYRSRLYKSISTSSYRLLLSSNDTCSHYWDIFPHAKCQPTCIPFLSDIEAEIEKLTPEKELSILNSYGLTKGEKVIRYVYIPNQFWSHKNHLVAFRGFVEYCRKNPSSQVHLICTGSIQDYRSVDYFQKVKSYVENSGYSDRIRILEFIDRLSQIAILKNCSTLLQPSLFEGWGTGVQEAKRFAKRIILSDIPIHIEQGDDRSFFFSSNESEDLALKLESCLNAEFPCLSESECKERYYSCAKQYSKNANQLFLPMREIKRSICQSQKS